jgi:O-antigen/teichoic acid export membrane protein
MTKQGLGSGVFYLLLGHISIGVAGYIIHLAVGRHYGPADYGTYVIIINLLMLLELLLVSGIPQAISKFISEEGGDEDHIKHTGLVLQGSFSVVLFLVYFLFSDTIASILQDPGLGFYIRVSALAIPLYAIYSLLDGYLNGMHRFQQQAISILAYSMLKVILVFAAIYLGYTITAVIVGFSIAPIAGLILALYYSGGLKPAKFIGWRRILGFSMPLVIASMAFLPMTTVDVFFVKALVRVKEDIGFYSAASIIASALYLIIQAVSKPVYPKISEYGSKNDRDMSRKTIHGSLRYSYMFLLLVSLLISAYAVEFVSLFYSSEFASAGEPLSILIVGFTFLCMFYLLTSIITASGRPKTTMFLTLVALAFNCILDLALIPIYGMNGAAIGTTIASMIGFAFALIIVYRAYGVLPVRSFFKITLSAGFIYFIGLKLEVSGLMLLPVFGLLGILYMLLLALLREIKINEMRNIIRLIVDG